MVWIQNQLVGAFLGDRLSLECHVEAFPKSINYWSSENGKLLTQGRYILDYRHIILYSSKGKLVLFKFRKTNGFNDARKPGTDCEFFSDIVH